ncbi:lipocalin family protein [Sulfurimonas diazotrophicus]|uniref:Lipocalin family protein n=1 Tax=Sulfurimonas diazotrophicus TaxID=3131939 RepID=A0ABZ3HA46_9BACT
MTKLLTLLTLTVLITLLEGCQQKAPVPLPTVEHVDLERYSGLWHEIARYENRFEEGCVGATATYRLKADHVAVVNRCYDDAGRLKDQARGEARVVEASGNAKLRVSFFWPFYGDYWIIMLADDYRYAVVGDPQRKYLWILARDTVLDDRDREAILARLVALKYDPFKLYWTGFKAMCNH